MTYKPSGIIISGNSCSGKSRTARPLLTSPKVVGIGTGDICRHHGECDTQLGEDIRFYMNKGAQVPDKILMPLFVDYTSQLIHNDPQDTYLEGVLDGHSFDKDSKLVLDGIPRNPFQVPLVSSIVQVDGVYFIDTPDEECLNRGLAKYSDRKGRADDKSEVLIARFTEFHTKVKPAMMAYENLRTIDGLKEPNVRQRELLEHMVQDGVIPSLGFLELPDKFNPFKTSDI